MGNYLFLLLVLACPLMMVFMMRGMHGGHGAGGGHDHNDAATNAPLDDLRRQREELDRQIDAREAEGQTPVESGWR